MDMSDEIKVLQSNVRELQSQLNDAQKRIGELIKEKSASNEEVVQQKQFIQELTNELKRVNSETEQKIQKQMDDIPALMDSKHFLREGK
tara:strand:+ start:1916 stop:2182 length:267 start_codon:yes stop_codon:yes gene_type:complete